jgi:flagellar hook protein FlgE
MSLYGALFTGISSMNANSQALSATSNNIANVNTIGYKSDQASFSSLMTTVTNSNTFAAGGVQATRQQNIDQQGLIQTSAATTDLAIAGNGFFTTSSDQSGAGGAGQTRYTRAGSFRPDGDGFLRNSAGLYLLGWKLDNQGNLPANRATVGTINLNNLTGTAQPTANMNIHANLQSSQTIQAAAATYDPANPAVNMASGVVTPDFERTIQIYDTQGGAQQLRMGFIKTAANTWQYEMMYAGPPTNVTTAANMPIASGTLTFNADGTLATPVGGSIAMTIPFDPATSGLNPQAIAVAVGSSGQLSGVTQFDSASTIISAGVDGALFGGLTGVKVSEDGSVLAIFDNGVQRKVYQLPVATFANPNGLIPTSGNAYLQSQDSGAASLVPAGTGGAGTISGSALESSTVDLAKEFTDLITTQRAYSAATRIITTADDMLQELERIKR